MHCELRPEGVTVAKGMGDGNNRFGLFKQTTNRGKSFFAKRIGNRLITDFRETTFYFTFSFVRFVLLVVKIFP